MKPRVMASPYCASRFAAVAALRVVSLLGLGGSFASLVYSLYVVGIYLTKQDVMPGWTTLSLQASGLFLLVFVMLSMIGEHLARRDALGQGMPVPAACAVVAATSVRAAATAAGRAMLRSIDALNFI